MGSDARREPRPSLRRALRRGVDGAGVGLGDARGLRDGGGGVAPARCSRTRRGPASGAQNAASTSGRGSIQAHLPSAWAAHASSEEERARHSEARRRWR